MTLDTRMRIHEYTDARELFDFCRDILGPSDGGVMPRDSVFMTGDGFFRNRLGQGYAAILEVTYAESGPLGSEWPCSCADDGCDPDLGEKCYVCRKPEAAIEISWDTAYGYRGPNGEGCGDLHAAFITYVAEWCDKRGLTYSWYNEFQGEWYSGLENLESLGKGGAEAKAWFTHVALPVIMAEAAANGQEYVT